MTLRLCSNLDSASDVTSPQVGTGGAEIGTPTYVPCKLGNGIFSNVNDEGCTFPTGANNINVARGTIECWIKPSFTPLAAGSHYIWSFLELVAPFFSSGITFIFNGAIDNFQIGAYHNGVRQACANATDFSWNIGDLIHLAATWDRTGILGSSKTLIITINNIERGSTTDIWEDDNTVDPDLYVGIDTKEWSHSDAVIDNLKAYDTCKIDFSDRLVRCSSYRGISAPPINLLCEQTKNPTNVGDPKPEFSAIHRVKEV